MLIKNNSGRLVEVPNERALEMVRRGEGLIIDQTPITKKERKPLVCPYCKREFNKQTECEAHKKRCKEAKLVSVIIPNRPFETNETREFIKKQTYPKIELINLTDRKKEGANVLRNRGFDKSKGKYILFSDNDIEWREDAIEILVQTLIDNPGSSYSYCSYTIDGKLVGDKEFSTHDLWKYNYISTMSLVRRQDFPRFDEKIKRFQDWDLWLTMLNNGKTGVYCGETLFKTKIRDGITYGKDAMEPSKARDILMKKHSIKDNKLADIIIPHQNRHDLLKDCLDRLSHDNFNVYVIEGGTFSHNCNKGAKIAETENLIFMNDDIEPNDDVIRQMLNNQADIAGCSQITPSWHPDKIWYGIEYKWRDGIINEKISDKKENCLIPTGFLFRIKKSVWEKLGGFDERYKNGGEDQDLFLKALEQGYTIDIIETPTIHHHSSSRDRFKHTSDNRTLLNKEWTEDRIKKLIDKK